MFLIVLMGIMAAAAATTWSFTGQRNQEEQLLFVGRAYRVAIARYADAHARSAQRYPTELAQLLADERQLVPTHYLRRLYFDPMTGSDAWGLVKTPDGGITGVYSLCERVPVRTQGRGDEGIAFAQAKSYRDWVFEVPAANAPGQRTPVAGWNYERDGEPPLRWEDSTPIAPKQR